MYTRILQSRFTKSLAVFLAMNILMVTSAKASGPVVVNAGTVVILETTSTLNSEIFTEGDTYDFRVRHDVIVEDEIIIAEGTIATGQVIWVEQSGPIGKPGLLELDVREVMAVDGQMIPISGAVLSREGKDKMVVSIVLAFICLLFLILEGEPAEIPPGTILNVTTSATMSIQPD